MGRFEGRNRRRRPDGIGISASDSPGRSRPRCKSRDEAQAPQPSSVTLICLVWAAYYGGPKCVRQPANDSSAHTCSFPPLPAVQLTGAFLASFFCHTAAAAAPLPEVGHSHTPSLIVCLPSAVFCCLSGSGPRLGFNSEV